MASRSLVLLGDEPDIPLYGGDMEADLRTVACNRLAEKITGGLAHPRKMPCPSWGISAARCRVGQLLARQAGTTCQKCYAMGGTYRFPSVQKKLEERFRGLFHPLWTPAMVFLIRWESDGFFRWFDSGDLAGVRHLQNIITICRHTRDVLHWLPTRERDAVVSCREEIPDNLTIRVSAPRVDGPPPNWWPHTSTMVSAQEPEESVCPSMEQDHTCGECRACWSKEVANVAYREH